MNRQQDGLWVVLAAGLIGVILAGSAAQAVQYTITDLGRLGGTSLHVHGINNAGQVVGVSGTGSGFHGFVWQNGVMTDLGTLGGSESDAYGINDSGQIVGAARASTPGLRAVVWNNGVPQDLNGTGPLNLVRARAINNAGQIVGEGKLSAFLWDNGQVTDLPFPQAYAINNAGQVAGTIYTGEYCSVGNPCERPVVWDDGNWIHLEVSGGFTSRPTGINDRGQVIGWNWGSSSITGFLWEDGVLREIPGPRPEYGAQPLGINNSGDIVGEWDSGDPDYAYGAFLYSQGTTIDLNTLLPADSGWHLAAANGINDLGQIVGIGKRAGDPYARGFLLTPVPEPATGALLCLAGIFCGRRKRQA